MGNFLKKIWAAVKFVTRESGYILRNVFLIFLPIIIGGFFYLYAKVPPSSALSTRLIPQATIIYDQTGKHPLYEIYGEENRKIISHQEIPDNMRFATIAAEDDDFYVHYGIDVKSILRALMTNVKNGEITQGGSTITQQLVRNAFFSREKTLRRKAMEAVMAIKIERHFGKDDILDMYLNEVPYGSNAYGIESAAKIYFGKRAQDLTLDEAAMLAAIPKATTYYSPYGENRPDLVARQEKILERIAKLGLVDTQIANDAIEVDTLAKIVPFSVPIEAPHFVFYVKNELEKKYGEDTVKESGMKVYTSLDYEMQKEAEKIVREGVGVNLKKYGAENAALVALDPKSGRILAMVGSRNYFDAEIDGEVNVATRLRQPGSSFKPFAYASAFEKGYQPETLILDAATNFGADGSGRNYVPRNYDGKFHGIVSMRQALAMSLNIPAIKTLRAVGIDSTIEMAQRLGITTLNDRERYGLSLVIGGGEVTLLDETAGYSVFANDGKRNPIDPFYKIENSFGKIVYENEAKNIEALDPQVARKMNSVLSDNNARIRIFGPNNLLHIDGKEVAAKTGTTQEWRDGWTVGYTPAIAVGVWVGNNDSRPMRAHADGSYVAAPIWNKMMSFAIPRLSEEKFVAYEKVEQEKKYVDKMTVRTAYFNKKTGKEISEKKMKKMKANKVEKRTMVVAGSFQKEVLPEGELSACQAIASC